MFGCLIHIQVFRPFPKPLSHHPYPLVALHCCLHIIFPVGLSRHHLRLVVYIPLSLLYFPIFILLECPMLLILPILNTSVAKCTMLIPWLLFLPLFSASFAKCPLLVLLPLFLHHFFGFLVHKFPICTPRVSISTPISASPLVVSLASSMEVLSWSSKLISSSNCT